MIGPGEPFHHDPNVTQRLDYEVELAVVIGRTGRDVAPAQALDHVFGFTIVNDITGRDLQRQHEQWFKGKGLDGSCPMGPAIVERGDIVDLGGLELSLTVDGQERQRAHVRDMIFDIPAIISSPANCSTPASRRQIKTFKATAASGTVSMSGETVRPGGIPPLNPTTSPSVRDRDSGAGAIRGRSTAPASPQGS